MMTTNSQNDPINHISLITKEVNNYSIPDQIRLKELMNFYVTLDTNCLNLIADIIMKSIVKENKISLRFLEWFVITYSQHHSITINKLTGKQINNSLNVSTDMDPNELNIYISYKSQLKAHTKKYFDPFKRQELLVFKLPKINKNIHTTIAQLTFFKWLIENKIINYINDNYQTLHKHMFTYNKCERKNKLSKKIKQLSLDSVSTESLDVDPDKFAFTVTI